MNKYINLINLQSPAYAFIIFLIDQPEIKLTFGSHAYTLKVTETQVEEDEMEYNIIQNSFGVIANISMYKKSKIEANFNVFIPNYFCFRSNISPVNSIDRIFSLSVMERFDKVFKKFREVLEAHQDELKSPLTIGSFINNFPLHVYMPSKPNVESMRMDNLAFHTDKLLASMISANNLEIMDIPELTDIEFLIDSPPCKNFAERK